MRTLSRIGLASVALVVFVLGLGWTYQRIAERRDDRRYPPPGELHLVQGRLMHIQCRGSGSPTVIVEQGIGGPAIDWTEINSQMARTTRVCDYDRAGMGYSEAAYKPTYSSDVAQNLHELLRKANVDDDLVFVAWSAGGLYVKEYYRRHPQRVKGMVLVDSTHEQTLQRMPPAPSNQENLDNLMRKYYLAQFGWLRLSGAQLPYARAPLSPEDKRRLAAFFLKSHTYRTLVDEGIGLEQDMARGTVPPKLGDMPLIVIAEGAPRDPYMIENLAKWHELQGELAKLSTQGKLVIAEKSAHFVHRTEPELILNAVKQVVDAVRTGQPFAAR
jgi:pimeloyl-ACP methyl ester carboxylesterase